MDNVRRGSSHSSGRALASVEWLDAHEAAKSAFRDAVVARWRLAPGARVVDIGCGPGYWTRRIAKSVGPTGTVIGVDVAADLIDIARVRNADLISANTCNFHLGSVDRIDQHDVASADVIVVLNVLGYVSEPSAALARLWRQLTPGTRLIIRQYDYGCTMYSGIPFDLQLRLLSGLANKLARAPLEPQCEAFLGRDLPSLVHRANIVNPEFTTDVVRLAAPLSPGAEYYLREKGLWIGEHATNVSREDAEAWLRYFDSSDPGYVLAHSDSSLTTIEFQAEAVK